MANGEEYYNPIISAYLRAVEQKNQKDQFHQKLQLESDQQKAEQKYRQQLADQAQQRIDSEHQAHLDELEQQKTVNAHNAGMLRIATDQAHRVMTDSVRKHILEGDSPESAAGAEGGAIDQGVPAYSIPPGGNEQPVGESIKLPGGTSIPTAGLMTPEREAQQVAQKAGLVTQAQHEAELPSQLILEKQKSLGLRLLEQNKQTFEANQKDLDRANRIDVAKLRIKSVENNVDPMVAENYANDLYVTGNQKITGVTPKLRASIVGSVPKGWTPIDPKDAAVIDRIPKLQEMLSLADKLAEQSFNTHPLNAIAGTAGYGPAGQLKDQLTSIAGDMAEFFGHEVGRKSEGDIKRAVDGLYSAKQGVTANKQSVDQARNIIQSTIQPLLEKYPPSQRDLILAKRGVKSSSFNGGPPTQETKKPLVPALDLGGGKYVPDTPENRQKYGSPE